MLQPPVSGCPFKLYSPVSDRSSRVAVTLTDLFIVLVCICLCLSVAYRYVWTRCFWGYFKVALTFIFPCKILNWTCKSNAVCVWRRVYPLGMKKICQIAAVRSWFIILYRRVWTIWIPVIWTVESRPPYIFGVFLSLCPFLFFTLPLSHYRI